MAISSYLKYALLCVSLMIALMIPGFAANNEDNVHASYYYDVSADTVRVQGFSPQYSGNESALITIEALNDVNNSLASVCTVVQQTANPEFVYDFANVSSWAADSYQINVDFYRSSLNCSGTVLENESTSAGTFDWLLLSQVLDDLQDLDDKVGDNITDLYDDVNALNASLTLVQSDLDGINASLQSQIDSVVSDVADVNSDLDTLNASLQAQIDVLDSLTINHTSQITDLEANVTALWADSTSQWSHITDLWSNTTALWVEVGALWVAVGDNQADINDLFILSNLLDQGTINLRYFGSSDSLNVWGKAPTGATTAQLRIYNTEDQTLVYSDNQAITQDAGANQTYSFRGGTGNAIDLTGWDNVSYNVRVQFVGVANGYRVTQIFSMLELEGIQDSVSVLQSDVLNLTLAVNDNTNEISALWDNATAQWILIQDLQEENAQQAANITALWADSQDQWDNLTLLWTQVGQLWQDSADQWTAIAALNASIQALDARLTDLEALVNYMNHATVNIRYRNKETNNRNNTLQVWGEAPAGADQYEVFLRAYDNQREYRSNLTNVRGTGANNPFQYNYFVDLNGIGYEGYNVFVRFYDENGTRMRGYNVGTIFNDLIGMGITLSGKDRTLYRLGFDDVTGFVSYNVKVDEDLDNVDVIIRSTADSDVNFSYTVEDVSFEASNNQMVFTDLTFSEIGEYELEIVINDTVWSSETFNVTVIDYPESDALVTAPAYNWFNGSLGYYPNTTNPYAAYSSLYWHSWDVSSTFDFELTAYEETSFDDCVWWSPEATGNARLSFDSATQVGNTTVCSATLSESSLSYDFSAEGLYTLTGRSEFFGVVVGKQDSRVIGIDNTLPVINSVTPNTGYWSSTVGFEVSTTDSLSGVDRVVVEIIEFNNTNATSLFVNTTFDVGSQTYKVDVDTVAENLTDGEYEVIAHVYDIAGNKQTHSERFFIDNTAPVISIVETNFAAGPFYEGDVAYAKVEVTDVLAGIDTVNLTFTGRVPVTCTLEQISGDGNNGLFETAADCRAPFYNGVVDLDINVTAVFAATDNAVPTNVGEENVTVNLVDPVINLTSTTLVGTLNRTTNITTYAPVATTCVEVSGVNSSQDSVFEWFTLTNTCNTTNTAYFTVALDDENITLELEFNDSDVRNVFLFDNFAISPKEAVVVNASYDAAAESLEFVADGNGTQEVVIYVGSLGNLEDLYFDGVELSNSNWTYNNGVVTATVTYGSPHTVLISWFKPATTSSGSSGGGGSGGSGYRLLEETLEENDLEEEPEQPEEPAEPEQEETVEVIENNAQQNNNNNNNDGEVEEVQTQTQDPGLGGNIAANVPTIVGIIIGILAIGGLAYFGMRKK